MSPAYADEGGIKYGASLNVIVSHSMHLTEVSNRLSSTIIEGQVNLYDYTKGKLTLL